MLEQYIARAKSMPSVVLPWSALRLVERFAAKASKAAVDKKTMLACAGHFSKGFVGWGYH